MSCPSCSLSPSFNVFIRTRISISSCWHPIRFNLSFLASTCWVTAAATQPVRLVLCWKEQFFRDSNPVDWRRKSMSFYQPWVAAIVLINLKIVMQKQLELFENNKYHQSDANRPFVWRWPFDVWIFPRWKVSYFVLDNKKILVKTQQATSGTGAATHDLTGEWKPRTMEERK